MKSELYNTILDIDIDSTNLATIFGADESVDNTIKNIFAVAKEEHDLECDRKGACLGVAGYILKTMKAVLASHEEYASSTVLVIVAACFRKIGEMEEYMEREERTKLGQIIRKGGKESFLEFLKERFGEDNVGMVDLNPDKDGNPRI